MELTCDYCGEAYLDPVDSRPRSDPDLDRFSTFNYDQFKLLDKKRRLNGRWLANAFDHKRRSALFLAIKNKNTKLVKYLIRKYPELLRIKYGGFFPLYFVIKKLTKHPEYRNYARILYEADPDVLAEYKKDPTVTVFVNNYVRGRPGSPKQRSNSRSRSRSPKQPPIVRGRSRSPKTIKINEQQ